MTKSTSIRLKILPIQ